MVEEAERWVDRVASERPEYKESDQLLTEIFRRTGAG